MPPITGEWQAVDLCCVCGTVLSAKVTESHWGKPCHGCGTVGDLYPPSVTTSRRFITTKKVWFGKDEGYWEWSGKRAGGGEVDPKHMVGRTMSNHTTTIVAAGIASGLF